MFGTVKDEHTCRISRSHEPTKSLVEIPRSKERSGYHPQILQAAPGAEKLLLTFSWSSSESQLTSCHATGNMVSANPLGID